MNTIAVYGAPPPALADIPPGAMQMSPRVPGSADLAQMAPGELERVILAAPDGVIERRFVLACALRALRPGGTLIAMAAKTRGGARLAGELAEFGCAVSEDYRRGWRLCELRRPETLVGIDEALAAGGMRPLAGVGWTQPGIFSWDRVDPGSHRLTEHLTGLKGEGADLGCGLGHLAKAVFAASPVKSLLLVDIDRRAIEAARSNVPDPRAQFLWADALAADLPTGLDFVVMNPPFHQAGEEDRALGVAFIRRAAALLRRGGRLRLVANRHLPYEAPLAEAFARVAPLADAGGYKVIEAVK